MQILFLAQAGALGKGILSQEHPLFWEYNAPRGGKGVLFPKAAKDLQLSRSIHGVSKEIPRSSQRAYEEFQNSFQKA